MAIAVEWYIAVKASTLKDFTSKLNDYFARGYVLKWAFLDPDASQSYEAIMEIDDS